MKPHVYTALIAIMLIAAPRQASAGLMVSNLGNTTDNSAGVFNFDFGSLSFGQDYANRFTTGSLAANFNAVTLGMGVGTNVPAGGFTVSLYSSVGGLPGANQGVTFTGNSNPFAAGQYTYAASAFTLAPDTSYWLVASAPHTLPNKNYIWNTTGNFSTVGVPGWSIDSGASRPVPNGTPASWSLVSNFAAQFSLDATLIPVPVPEPSGIATGLLCVGVASLRRQRHRAPR